jgi:hypothetical protein
MREAHQKDFKPGIVLSNNRGAAVITMGRYRFVASKADLTDFADKLTRAAEQLDWGYDRGDWGER